MENPIDFLKGIFKHVVQFFNSDKVHSVEQSIASIIPIALTVIQEIDSFLPQPEQLVIGTVVNIANHYVIPINEAALISNDALKNALQNIARDVVKSKLPIEQQTIANNVINAAVTAAVALAHS